MAQKFPNPPPAGDRPSPPPPPRATMTAAELVQEAIELADEFARADVECNCPCVDRGPPPTWDTSGLDRENDATVLRSIQYCEMRKLLRRLPEFPHIVYFV